MIIIVGDDLNAIIEVDFNKLFARIDALELKVYETVKEGTEALDILEVAKTKSHKSMIKYAQVGFNILDSTLEMFGIAIPQSVSMIVNTILGAAPALTQLALGNIGLGNISAIGALLNITASVAMAIAFEDESEKGTNDIRYTQQLMRSMLNLWGT